MAAITRNDRMPLLHNIPRTRPRSETARARRNDAEIDRPCPVELFPLDVLAIVFFFLFLSGWSSRSISIEPRECL